MRLSLALPLIAATGLAACLPPHPPPAPAPGEVIPNTADVALSRLPASAVAAYLGTYRSGSESLVVRRAGAQLFADRNGRLATAPLKLIGLGTFSDNQGTTYLFDSGAGLRTFSADGTSRDWVR